MAAPGERCTLFLPLPCAADHGNADEMVQVGRVAPHGLPVLVQLTCMPCFLAPLWRAACKWARGREHSPTMHPPAAMLCRPQREKKTLKPILGENGKPVPLTSHTLAPVPLAIGGKGLPANVVGGLGPRSAAPCCAVGRTQARAGVNLCQLPTAPSQPAAMLHSSPVQLDFLLACRCCGTTCPRPAWPT